MPDPEFHWHRAPITGCKISLGTHSASERGSPPCANPADHGVFTLSRSKPDALALLDGRDRGLGLLAAAIPVGDRRASNSARILRHWTYSQPVRSGGNDGDVHADRETGAERRDT